MYYATGSEVSLRLGSREARFGGQRTQALVGSARPRQSVCAGEEELPPLYFAQIRVYPLDLLRDEEAAGSNPATPTQVRGPFLGLMTWAWMPVWERFGSRSWSRLPAGSAFSWFWEPFGSRSWRRFPSSSALSCPCATVCSSASRAETGECRLIATRAWSAPSQHSVKAVMNSARMAGVT